MTEAAQQPQQPSAPVDPIFPRFFKDSDDQQPKLVGLIAYGLYEEARREWVDTLKAREGRYPNLDELRAYESSWTASRLDGLKNAAIQILASYADTISSEVETQALHRALRGGFIKGVVRWMVSAVLFLAAVLALFVALSRAGLDPIASYRSLLQPAEPATAGVTNSPANQPRTGATPAPLDAMPETSSSAPAAEPSAPVPPGRRSGR